MFIREVITQERKIPSHATIVKKTYIGPLGTALYILHSDQEIVLEEAYPHKLVLLTRLFDSYNIAHYLEMIRFFLIKTINCNPTNFIINKFASTKTTHIYPLYKDEHIYLCREESRLVELNPINLLGLYPITNDPLCLFEMKIPNSILWEDICLVRSSDKQSQAQFARNTIMSVQRRRRCGDKGVNDPPLLAYNRR